MTKKEKIACNVIIHTATVAAGSIGVATAQIPCADSIPLSLIQITMIVSLGKVFGINIAKSVAKAIIGAFAASFAGRSIVQISVGWIPGPGNIINASTAAGLTEMMGWFVANSFAKNMTIEQTINNIKRTQETEVKDILKLEEEKVSEDREKEQKINIPEYSDEDIISKIEFEEDNNDMR